MEKSKKRVKKGYNYPITIPVELKDDVLLLARYESGISDLSFNKCVELAIKDFVNRTFPKYTKEQKERKKVQHQEANAMLFAGV